MTDRNSTTPEVLLNDLSWLRSLAWSLVRDKDQAEDLVQETLVVALESPPRHSGAWRAWLRQVARNLVYKSYRTRSRRERREQVAARPDVESIDLDASLERAELHGRLVDFVLALEEPYRTTVVLRYFEELTPTQIAERLDIPAGTVRVRLKRAHDQLRQRLDRAHDGNRSLWMVPLMEIAGRSGKTTSVTLTTTAASGLWMMLGGWIMSNKVVAAMTAIVLLFGGALLWSSDRWNSSVDDPELATIETEGDSTGGALASDAGRVGEGSGEESGERGTIALDSPVLVGRVVDTSGDPVSGVRLGWRSGTKFLLSESDRDGVVEWREAGVFPAQIVSRDDDFISDGEWSHVSAEESQRAEFTVIRGGVISGIVVDQETGEPVQDVWAQAFQQGRAGGASTPTGADGRFRIRGLATGSYDVAASMERQSVGYGLDLVSVKVDVDVAIEGIELTVDPGEILHGIVTWAGKEEPAIRARVIAESTRSSQGTASTSSDDRGRFQIRVPRYRESPWRLIASTTRGDSSWKSQAFLVATDPDSEPASESEPDREIDVRLVLEPTGSIAGRFVDSSRAPIPHHTTWIARSGEATRRSVEGDAEGRFVVEGLVSGEYLVGERPIAVNPGERTDGVEIVCDRGLGLDLIGRVVDVAGEPIENVEVMAYLNSGFRQVKTDASGRFVLPGVTPPRLSLSLSRSGYSSRSVEVDPRAARSDPSIAEFTLQGTATVTGRIYDRVTGAPITRFSIFSRGGKRADPEHLPIQGLREKIAKDGSYEVESASCPMTTIFVRVAGYVMAQEVVALEPGQHMTYDIVLDPIPSGRGRVFDAAGRPVSDAAIFAFEPQGTYVPEDQALAVSGADGRFDVECLVETNGTLWAVHSEYAPGRVEYQLEDLGHQPLRIELSNLARVFGVVTVGGQPASGVQVFLALPRSIVASVETDALGRYEARVPAGSYMIRATHGPSSGNQVVDHVNATIANAVEKNLELKVGNSRVTGRVHLAGVPPVRATVALMGVDSDPSKARMTSPTGTNPDGSFEFLDVASGSYRVVVQAVFAGDKTLTKVVGVEVADADPAPIDLDLGGGLDLTLNVSGLATGDAAIAILLRGEVEVPQEITQQALMPLLSSVVSQLNIPANGTHPFASLEPGQYTVLIVWGESSKVARGPVGMASRSTVVTVGDGANELRLDLEQ